MDPNACLLRLVEAATCGDADETEAAAVDLVEWLRAGGFAPDAAAPLNAGARWPATGRPCVLGTQT